MEGARLTPNTCRAEATRAKASRAWAGRGVGRCRPRVRRAFNHPWGEGEGGVDGSGLMGGVDGSGLESGERGAEAGPDLGDMPFWVDGHVVKVLHELGMDGSEDAHTLGATRARARLDHMRFEHRPRARQSGSNQPRADRLRGKRMLRRGLVGWRGGWQRREGRGARGSEGQAASGERRAASGGVPARSLHL